MPLSDFLAEGADIPAGSALKSTVTNKVLPEWYTNYAMLLLANQNAVGQSPYTPYSAPRLAGFSPDQLKGFETARDAATAYQPFLDQSQDMYGQAAGASALSGALPYFGQAAGMDPSAVAAGDYGAARNFATTAGGMSGATAALPWFNMAGGNVANVDEYMNPYTDKIVNRIGELGQRNLMENIMPALEGRYIKAGQFQGSGQMTDTARAIRDTSSDILGAQSAALQAGYGAAQTAKAGDLSRFGNIGTSFGQLTQGAQSGALNAATTLGNLGTAAAGLTQAQQQMLTNMGINVGNLTASDATRLASIAGSMGALGGNAQTWGMTGAGALADIGKQQTGFNQSNLDMAYADFLKQQGYPQEQINAMLGTYKGIGDTLPWTQTEHGIVPSGVQPQYDPSTFSDIASAGSGLAGIIKELHDAGLF